MHKNPAIAPVSLLSRAKQEAQEIGLVTLYFLFCFSVVLALKKLLLASYDIEVYVLSTVVISALIVAKVVVVLDKTRAGTRFETTRALGLAALYKTLVYTAVTAGVLFLEKLVHAYRESGALGEAILTMWAHRDRNMILAKVLCVGLAFAGYHLYTGLDRQLGEGTLRRLVMTRGGQPTSRPSVHSPHAQQTNMDSATDAINE
jgi:hypothetical protein